MTYPATKCFWLNPTDRIEVGLRRYHTAIVPPGDECPREGGRWKYHGALALIGDAPLVGVPVRPDGCEHSWSTPDETVLVSQFIYPDHGDLRWPTRCECGYEFTPDDAWQGWAERLFVRVDTGEVTTIRDAPPGAMWDAWWYPWKGADGLSLVVKCPNGATWSIDGRARNCTLPHDSEHRCWVRHGEPPNITVDKDGLTCAAGAGSIAAGDYHGFLRNGELTAG